jgi:hypothetical protein
MKDLFRLISIPTGSNFPKEYRLISIPSYQIKYFYLGEKFSESTENLPYNPQAPIVIQRTPGTSDWLG